MIRKCFLHFGEMQVAGEEQVLLWMEGGGNVGIYKQFSQIRKRFKMKASGFCFFDRHQLWLLVGAKIE